MELLDALSTRRSYRKFKQDSMVDEDSITDVLKAAMTGPSAGNTRPWEFIVIRDRNILSRIGEMRPYMKEMLEQVPVMIIVVFNEEREKYPNRWIQDCSVVTQNILLAVHAKGFAGSWQEIYPEEKTMKGMHEILSLPDNVIPFAMVPIGEPDEEKDDRKTFEEEIIHFDEW